ncbi:MAG: HPr family phosphocarrier protein [Pseudomonadales bacterium]
MITRTIVIKNKLGLHARAASKLVEVALSYSAKIEIGHSENLVNCKSIMSVLMLAAGKGTELSVRAQGEDEAEAVEAIVALIDNLFGEAE